MMGVSQEVTPLLLLSLSGDPGWVSILLRTLVWTWGLLPGGWELGGAWGDKGGGPGARRQGHLLCERTRHPEVSGPR